MRRPPRLACCRISWKCCARGCGMCSSTALASTTSNVPSAKGSFHLCGMWMNSARAAAPTWARSLIPRSTRCPSGSTPHYIARARFQQSADGKPLRGTEVEYPSPSTKGRRSERLERSTLHCSRSVLSLSRLRNCVAAAMALDVWSCLPVSSTSSFSLYGPPSFYVQASLPSRVDVFRCQEEVINASFSWALQMELSSIEPISVISASLQDFEELMRL